MINVAILGSTGSIGTQTLQVIESLPDYQVFGISGNQNAQLLAEQSKRYNPEYVVVGDSTKVGQLSQAINGQVMSGVDGLCELASHPDVDIVVVAIVGAAGLLPTLAALEAGKVVALSNKETLVAGGHLVMKYRSKIIPIDSEHSAIWQCLDGKNKDEVDSLILTASGGPFRKHPQDLSHVTVAQALKHPNWDMGGKITIDSATLMNKGLEVIEAHWLFDISYDQIEVIVHPQSIIHSMVRFKDGSIIAQMATTDMRLPIQYALTYPNIEKSIVEPLDLSSLPDLTFERHDSVRFPALKLAYQAGEIGGTMPTVLNAANEVAVEMFMKKRILFTDIPIIITEVMNQHQPIHQPTVSQILKADQETRAAFKKGRI